jgi:hypothetical protein
MVAAMTERRSARRRKCIDQLARRQTLRRKPPRRIGKGRGNRDNEGGNQRQ